MATTRTWITFGTLTALAAAAAGAVLFGRARWRRASEKLIAELEAAQSTSGPSVFDPQELTGLPAPVVRYFEAALRPGQPIIRRACVRWQGKFNMGKPGKDNWKPFTATQVFIPGAPGFVWDAKIAAAPGLAALVRDAFVGGVGSMHGAILGLVPVVDSEGTPEIARAALQRYLGEAAWLPTALLPSQGAQWTAIDDHRAKATLTAGDTTAAVEFRFGEDGLIHSVYVPDRLFDNGKEPPSPKPWQGRNLNFVEQHGMKVPGDSVVEWLLPDGPYAYWQGRAVEMEIER